LIPDKPAKAEKSARDSRSAKKTAAEPKGPPTVEKIDRPKRPGRSEAGRTACRNGSTTLKTDHRRRPDRMDAPHTKPHTQHMTPAQAAAAAGVSRWAIMRAINRQQLKAHRNNRNQWQITPEDLQAHYPHSVRSVRNAHPDDSTELRANLAGETARADAAERARDQAEADRDRWQRMAEKLAEKPRFVWPWQR